MSEPQISLQLLQQAEQIFKDSEAAHAWFFRPNLSLAGLRPIDELRDPWGETIVGTLLDAMDEIQNDPNV